MVKPGVLYCSCLCPCEPLHHQGFAHFIPTNSVTGHRFSHCSVDQRKPSILNRDCSSNLPIASGTRPSCHCVLFVWQSCVRNGLCLVDLQYPTLHVSSREFLKRPGSSSRSAFSVRWSFSICIKTSGLPCRNFRIPVSVRSRVFVHVHRLHLRLVESYLFRTEK